VQATSRGEKSRTPKKKKKRGDQGNRVSFPRYQSFKTGAARERGSLRSPEKDGPWGVEDHQKKNKRRK